MLNKLKSSGHIIYRGATPASDVARSVKRIPIVFKSTMVCRRLFNTSKSFRRKRRIECDQVLTRRLAKELYDKWAEINHIKIPTCKSDPSEGAASTRESCCYKICVRSFVVCRFKFTFDIISSSKPAARVNVPAVIGNDASVCNDDTCPESDSLEW